MTDRSSPAPDGAPYPSLDQIRRVLEDVLDDRLPGITDPAERRWVTRPGVGRRYSISTRTVDRWERDGKIPPADRSGGRNPRWSVADLDAHDNRRMGGAR